MYTKSGPKRLHQKTNCFLATNEALEKGSRKQCKRLWRSFSSDTYSLDIGYFAVAKDHLQLPVSMINTFSNLRFGSFLRQSTRACMQKTNFEKQLAEGFAEIT